MECVLDKRGGEKAQAHICGRRRDGRMRTLSERIQSLLQMFDSFCVIIRQHDNADFIKPYGPVRFCFQIPGRKRINIFFQVINAFCRVGFQMDEFLVFFKAPAHFRLRIRHCSFYDGSHGVVAKRVDGVGFPDGIRNIFCHGGNAMFDAFHIRLIVNHFQIFRCFDNIQKCQNMEDRYAVRGIGETPLCKILPIMKGKTMDAVISDDLLKILDSMTPGLLSPAYGVFGSSFKYAKKHVLINKNPATSAISIKRKQVSKIEANERAAAANEQDGCGHQSKNRKYALTSEQAGQMLLIAKNKYPGLYLPLLIACITGCLISELVALRYRDVDYNKKVLHVTAQAGRPIDISGLEKGSRTKQRLETKSRNGIRDLPVPDFVLDEIAASYKRWTQSLEAEGKDAGEVTIWHRADGTAYNRRSYKDDFNSLKKLYGLPDDFHWHDLRHVYATLMIHYQVNIKELAIVLGHSSGIFTMQHYVVLKETLIFEVPGFDEYSENLIKSSTIEA